MADLLIQGMHLPKLGYVTTITIYHDGTVADEIGNVETVKAVELPPHEELVQRSDIIGLFDENNLSARKAVMKAPTIVPASKEK